MQYTIYMQQADHVHAFCVHLQEVIEKVKTSGRIKTTLESHFFFKDPARRGRGRSGGGGGRGGFEGRGGGRSNFEGSRGGFEGNRDRDGGRYEGNRDRDGGRYESSRDRDGGRYEGGRYEGGRGSGGRGQGGGRRFNRRDRAPNVEDERDFPSLGGGSAPVAVM